MSQLLIDDKNVTVRVNRYVAMLTTRLPSYPSIVDYIINYSMELLRSQYLFKNLLKKLCPTTPASSYDSMKIICVPSCDTDNSATAPPLKKENSTDGLKLMSTMINDSGMKYQFTSATGIKYQRIE